MTPASFFYQSAFGNLGIQVDAGDSLTVQEASGAVTFILSQGHWFAILGSDQPTTDAGPILGFDAAHPLFGALVIAGGAPQPAWGAEALLRHKPFQLLGLISYSLYLWHWPILIIATLALCAQEAMPRMASVDPASAKVGDVVTVTGENLQNNNNGR